MKLRLLLLQSLRIVLLSVCTIIHAQNESSHERNASDDRSYFTNSMIRLGVSGMTGVVKLQEHESEKYLGHDWQVDFLVEFLMVNKSIAIGSGLGYQVKRLKYDYLSEPNKGEESGPPAEELIIEQGVCSNRAYLSLPLYITWRSSVLGNGLKVFAKSGLLNGFLIKQQASLTSHVDDVQLQMKVIDEIIPNVHSDLFFAVGIEKLLSNQSVLTFGLNGRKAITSYHNLHSENLIGLGVSAGIYF